jgi:endonuclease/exonuclease/phosphatase family metal-dependent hydrolase
MPTQMVLTIALWNVEWAKPGSSRATFFQRRLCELSCPVICLTEGYPELLPPDGHVILSEADYGYPLQAGRHKVLIWSREPWQDVDTLGSPLLPSGRFVAGTTNTPIGPVRFVGVCIPWRDAHVRTGRKDRQPWQDHLTYLQHLGSVLAQRTTKCPAIMLGDLNQRVPRAGQPEAVFSALTDALSCGFELVTSGSIPGTPELAIDHLAATSELAPTGVEHLDRHDENGEPMSDHFGLRIHLQNRNMADNLQH